MRVSSLLMGVLLSCSVVHAEEEADPAASRRAWQYVGTRDKKLQLFQHQRDKQWQLHRSSGKVTPFTELQRDDQQIIVQNNETNLIIRLTAERGYWRRPGDAEDDWKTWVTGKWVDPPASKIVVAREPKEYVVKLAYFVPQDRQPIPNYDRKIRVVMQFVAQLYRTDLQGKGYESAGFHFEMQGEEPRVHLIRGQRTAGYYNNAPQYDADEQWRRLVPEIRRQFGSAQDQVQVVFAETYDHGPAEHLWPGVIARGAYHSAEGGLAIYTSHILRDAFCALTVAEQKQKFFDRRPVPGRRAYGNKMNSPRGEFTEDGIGAVAHELGHAFGLPHDQRRDSIYIMGNGFRNLRHNFFPSRSRWARFSDENALLLMSSRYLNPKLDASDSVPAIVQLKLVPQGRALFADLSAKDENGLRSVVFSDLVEGTVIGGRALEGTEQAVRIRLPKVQVSRGQVEIRAIVTDAGGHQTRVVEKLRVR